MLLTRFERRLDDLAAVTCVARISGFSCVFEAFGGYEGLSVKRTGMGFVFSESVRVDIGPEFGVGTTSPVASVGGIILT